MYAKKIFYDKQKKQNRKLSDSNSRTSARFLEAIFLKEDKFNHIEFQKNQEGKIF